MRQDLTAEYVRSILDYDPETGILRWKRRTDLRKHAAGWNARYVGQMAGLDDHKGHLAIAIHNRRYQAHRIIWLWFYGEWPKCGLDHINCDGFDNRISNLREATVAQNGWNMRAYKKKKHGIGLKGACFHKQSGRWHAKIFVDGRSLSLGLHHTEESAHAAYCAAATEHRGDFARFK